MEHLDLEQLGVQEMNAREIKETDGGFLQIIAGAIAIAGAIIYIYNNADDFVEGFNEGYKQ